MEKKTIVAFANNTYLGEHNINDFTANLHTTYEKRLDLLEAIHSNLVIRKYVDLIDMAIDTDNFEYLTRFGINKENLGKKVYINDQLKKVGLDIENDGTGKIDNIICKYYEDCSDLELELINIK